MPRAEKPPTRYVALLTQHTELTVGPADASPFTKLGFLESAWGRGRVEGVPGSCGLSPPGCPWLWPWRRHSASAATAPPAPSPGNGHAAPHRLPKLRTQRNTGRCVSCHNPAGLVNRVPLTRPRICDLPSDLDTMGHNHSSGVIQAITGGPVHDAQITGCWGQWAVILGPPVDSLGLARAEVSSGNCAAQSPQQPPGKGPAEGSADRGPSGQARSRGPSRLCPEQSFKCQDPPPPPRKAWSLASARHVRLLDVSKLNPP